MRHRNDHRKPKKKAGPPHRAASPAASDRAYRLVIGPEQAGATLAAIVRAALDGIPWSKARDYCASGRVQLDGTRVTDPAMRVEVGAAIEITPTAPRLRGGTLAPEALVFVDGDIVVVEKPAGIMSVPFATGDRDHLLSQTQAALRRMPGVGRQSAPLGVVQRLDKDTTGLLVFTRNLAAKRALGGQLRRRTMHRRYLAIVHGVMDPAERTFESWLVRNRGDGLRGSFGVFRRPRGPRPADAQHAVTHARVRDELTGATLVECKLESGRQHQIRIHLSEAGHPLVGERVYIRDYDGPRITAGRPMLHAAELGFDHPRTGKAMRFESPLPADFQQRLDTLRR